MWLLSIIILYLLIDNVKSTVDFLQHPVKTCRIGDAVENECIRCLCTSKNVFECTLLDCDRNKANENLDATQPLCFPSQLYVQDLITCICTKDGKWPHKSCHETFQALPPSKVISHKCEPNTYVSIDCNVCRCGPDGEVINDRCTKNACEDEPNRRSSISSDVYSKCETKNWYSLAPCQFCFCVHNNKLVCNTGNTFTQQLELGSYSLKICGQDFIKEAMDLIPDDRKIIGLRLRQGNITTTTTTTTPKPKLSVVPYLKEPEYDSMEEIAIEVNREGNENKNHQLVSKASSSSEYSSESNEGSLNIDKGPATAKATVIKKPRLVLSTMLPYTEEDIQPYHSNYKTQRVNQGLPVEEKYIETELVENQPEDPSPKKFATYPAIFDDKDIQILKAEGIDDAEIQVPRGASSAESLNYIGNTLKINLPKVLNKVFQLALRKSMVSLSSGTECVPGETMIRDCNTCFCLKNSKLLCSNRKCTEDEKA